MNLLSSASVFSLFTLISRILGYVRDILIAIFLGATIFADAFFVAFRLPNTFRRLFAEGTFNAAFVPSYSSEITKGKKQSNKFANDIFNHLFYKLSKNLLLLKVSEKILSYNHFRIIGLFSCCIVTLLFYFCFYMRSLSSFIIL